MFSLVNRTLLLPRIIGPLTRANSNINRVNVNQNRLKLFGDDVSPPVRFVKMTASELKVPLEFIEIDLFKRENINETYTAINPLQKVPALVVGKHNIMVDSHSIAMYLCDAFDKKEVLYSKDPIERSKINDMLFYNSCYLFPIDSEMFCEFFESCKPVSAQKRESWDLALDFLNKKLECTPWLAGEKCSLADLCCMATISTTQLIVPPNKRHKKLNEWMEKMVCLPCFEVNLVGLEKLYCHVEKIQPRPISR